MELNDKYSEISLLENELILGKIALLYCSSSSIIYVYLG